MDKNAKLALHIIIHILGITITALTFYWAEEYIGFKWKGYGKYVWHPTLMVLGTVYLLGVALVTFSLMTCKEKALKIIHQICMIIMFVLMIFALAVVIDTKSSDDHFVTLHGWFGLITVVILIIEVPLFVIVYGFDCCSSDVQNKLRPMHKISGIIILLLCLACNLTGVQGHISPFPFAEKMILDVIGLLTFIFTLIILFVLIERKTADDFIE